MQTGYTVSPLCFAVDYVDLHIHSFTIKSRMRSKMKMPMIWHSQSLKKWQRQDFKEFFIFAYMKSMWLFWSDCGILCKKAILG